MTIEEKTLEDVANRWHIDTASFVREALGVGSVDDCKQIDHQQLLFLQTFDALVSAKEKRVRKEKLTPEETLLANKIGIIIRSGKGCGKTSALSWISEKALFMFEECKILATAPKQDLLRDNLWGEIAYWQRYSENVYQKGQSPVVNAMVVQAETVYMKRAPGSNYMVARTCSRNGSPEDQKATLQGYHAPYFFSLVDEAWGTPDLVFEPILSTQTGAVNFCILAGNPTKNYGFAHEAYGGKYKDFFIQIQFDGEQSTLVASEYIATQKIFYKDDPNGYRVNVRGLPPEDTENTLIPYSKIMEATYREIPNSFIAQFEPFGIADVGAGGDNSTFATYWGPQMGAVSSFSSNDPSEVARFICYEARKTDANPVGIDGIGVGWGLEPSIKAEHINCQRITLSKNAFNRAKFFNLRSELAWILRMDFINGDIAIPNDPELIKELACLRLERPVDNTKIQLQSKQKMIREGTLEKSPNKADNVIMSRYYTRRMGFTKEDTGGQPLREESRRDYLYGDVDRKWRQQVSNSKYQRSFMSA